MRSRKSFVIRWLDTTDAEGKEVSIIDVEHVQTSRVWRVKSAEEAAERMRKVASENIPSVASQAIELAAVM